MAGVYSTSVVKNITERSRHDVTRAALLSPPIDCRITINELSRMSTKFMRFIEVINKISNIPAQMRARRQKFPLYAPSSIPMLPTRPIRMETY